MRAAVILVVMMGVARADDTPTEQRRPVPSIRPVVRHTGFGFGIVAGLGVGVGIAMTLDPQTERQRDAGPWLIGTGIAFATSSVTMFVQSRASDPEDDIEARERAHTYKVAGLTTVAGGIALAIGGGYVAEHLDETVGSSMLGGAFVAAGVGVALVAISIEYRAVAPIAVAPTGNGVAITGAF
jgi:hypothetical protein